MPVTIRIESIVPKSRNYPMDRFELFKKRMRRYLYSDLGPHLKREYERTVEGWQHKPTFPAEVTEPYGTQLKLAVGPKGKHTVQWQRVSGGTGPRRIVPRRASAVMRFPAEYIPKTTPGGRYGGPGLKHGPMQARKVIYNHEIEPRQFSERIAEKNEGRIVKDVAKEIKRAFR